LSTSRSPPYTLSLHDALPIFRLAMGLVQLGEVLPPLPVEPGACCGEPLPQGVLARPVQPRTCLLRLLPLLEQTAQLLALRPPQQDRKSTRLNSSHVSISYAVF